MLMKYITLVNLLKKTNDNVNIIEVEGKIPSIIDLAATNAVRNKTPNVSIQAKKKVMIQNYQTMTLNIYQNT